MATSNIHFNLNYEMHSSCKYKTKYQVPSFVNFNLNTNIYFCKNLSE